MIAPHHQESPLAKAGREIYERQIKQQLLPEHDGQLLVIDTVSGDYEVAANDVQAVMQLKKRCEPGGFYIMRIGQPAVYRIGSFQMICVP